MRSNYATKYKKNVLDAVGESWAKKLESIYKRDFLTKADGGRGMSGTRWRPLSARTVAAKARRGSRYARRILMYSGRLQASIRAVYVKRDLSIMVMATDKTAKYHDEGNSKLPQRKLFDELSDKYRSEIEKDIVERTDQFFSDFLRSFNSANFRVNR